MKLPLATYRLQLRDGVDFDAAIAFLPHLTDLGITDLYLSPIFTATPGSTHGYDVTDPTEIDPALGGRVGFDRLSEAAQAAGIGLILDLVPNHTAFSLDNPWLIDVLREGRDSRHAKYFDIDWDEGPLVLPWLEQSFEALLAAGEVARDGDGLRIGGLTVPLRADAEGKDLAELHEAQHWRAVHWLRERDGVTHRRFFNVTGLIGMRVEDPEVFADMHRLVVELVEAGQVQGLRLDHIDGLADPAAYLSLLRLAVGDVPIWVEKILTGDERLADWPIEGTTGYEAATMIARVLSDGEGAERLRREWVAQTEKPGSFHETLAIAKGDVIRRDLAAELRRLISLARQATDGIDTVDPGDEALREAFLALLTAFPRYRTYFSDNGAPEADLRLMAQVAEEAAEPLRSPDVVNMVVRMITDDRTPAEQKLRVRFQQVTGAMLAKAHEDTAEFRFTPLLAACEVGADPDAPSADAAELEAWAAAQPGTGLILTSSHDTKRSEDARMRLVAWTRRPEASLALVAAARALPEAREVPGNVLWYMVQAVLAIWDAEDPELDRRLAEHATKALREGDEITSWTHPDAEAEASVHRFLGALTAAWRAAPPPGLGDLVALGDRLALVQLGVKLMLPGIPDIYRGCEGQFLALTDPDNRSPVDLAALRRLSDAPGLSGQKTRLLTMMLHLKRERPELFAGALSVSSPAAGTLELRRGDGAGGLALRVALDGSPCWPGRGGRQLWPQDPGRDPGFLTLVEMEAATAQA
ncbi:malto-oligosyltrehalose synthase [Oceaniglobus roseus]|uniref:malto-oligosyltrehalose synthase n=1 Tax=Oceaniglobus roseus TaxID=1737570 RepID=UPI000C7F1D87|nr:malto-oligosyltrehalose synthase [Kandeliimicrobium roseum]